MQTITYTNARNNLKDIMNKVNIDHEPVTVARANASAVVIMSEEDYNSLNETLYILSSPNNAAHLNKSINEAKSGNLKKYSIKELKNEFYSKSN